jgi:hypothetical protein
MVYNRLLFSLMLFFIAGSNAFSQTGISALPAKVSHAEPVFFDLIRDLGARKGERELNIGMGMVSTDAYTIQSYLVEYEFAPVNRLGVEIELPFSFHKVRENEDPAHTKTDTGLEGIKAAFQYSFFVSEKHQATLAVGYIYEMHGESFNMLQYTGSTHNPFLIIAKRWGRLHTLLYTGPSFESAQQHHLQALLVNTNIDYVLPGTKNFIGIELNKEITTEHLAMMVRPQIKMALSNQVALGLAIGIPAGNTEEKLDFLLRWIYEPRKKSSR